MFVHQSGVVDFENNKFHRNLSLSFAQTCFLLLEDYICIIIYDEIGDIGDIGDSYL